ncbi:MAG: hypothetical protein WDO73_14875 [Ignavibacteriota bacterium]
MFPAASLAEVPLGEGWRVTLLVDNEPGPLPPQVETLETKRVHRLSLPTYCEVDVEQVKDAFAKVRTVGLTPDAIPSIETMGEFLLRAADRRVPFKATAGLHHPIRSLRAVTYAADSPRATMHGFLNVFIAAAFAWQSMEREILTAILGEEDPRAFRFDEDELSWRDRHLSCGEIEMPAGSLLTVSDRVPSRSRCPTCAS